MDNYEPDGFGGPVQKASFSQPPLKLLGNTCLFDARKGNDEFTQAGDLYRLLNEEEKHPMTSVIAGTMKGVPEEIVRPHLVNFLKCDEDYGNRICKRVGIKI